jgi:SAM-dependent methyltransferase
MSFDALSPTYDTDFTHTRTGQYLREQVHARLQQYFHAGNHVLELGCGTGEDALHLAQRGVCVTATDASPAMLEITRAKIGSHPLVNLQLLDLQELGRDVPLNAPTENFDGAFSNFGPLNVLSDWHPLAEWLAARIKPGGIAAFGVMSPFCMWELLWHSVHGDFPTAFRRLRKKSIFQPSENANVMHIYYPTVHRLTRDFAPYFRRVRVRGLGLFLPPSDVYGAVEKRPRLYDVLLGLEKRFAPIAPLAMLADHYWIEFERI